MLFRRALFGSFALIFLLLAASFFLHIRIRSFDAFIYRELVRESAELHSRRALEREAAHQMREGVQKDIWAMNGEERLHFRLKSVHSHLTLTQKKDKVEAVEELQHIECWIQEEIDRASKMQQVRTLIAQKGLYTFPSHRFTAEAVRLAFFCLPGVEFPSTLAAEKPYLTGIAREMSFATTSKTPIFTAYHIQAKLDPERGLP